MSDATRWMSISPDQYDEPEEVDLQLDAGSFISPYDVPDGVRVTYDPAKQRAVIEFRYLVDEPWQDQDRDEGTSVFVGFGKYSNRIIRLELHADLPDLLHHRPKWIRAISAAIGRLRSPDKANYHVTRRVLDDQYDKLLSRIEPEYGGR